MNKYYIVSQHYKNANTPEFGMGDYPEKTRYVKAIVYADTKRKAQGVIKKAWKGSLFGDYGLWIFSEDEREKYSWVSAFMETLKRSIPNDVLSDTFISLKKAFKEQEENKKKYKKFLEKIYSGEDKSHMIEKYHDAEVPLQVLPLSLIHISEPTRPY